MKKIILSVLSILLLISVGCNKLDSEENNDTKSQKVESKKDYSYEINKEDIILKYENSKPKEWGEHIEGIINKFKSEKNEIALTLDACGGKNGSGYDKELIDFLIDENIKATLFVNYRWLENNKETFLDLANNSNFEIENHGYGHKPLSVNGNSIYNIKGTKDINEVIDEIKLNEDKIYELTNRKTKFFRSGTAYYDDIAIKISEDLGYNIAGFSINGDGGATYTKEEVYKEVMKSKSGDIIICHFNQPNGNTFEGLKDALLDLKNQGYSFLKLEEIIK